MAAIKTEAEDLRTHIQAKVSKFETATRDAASPPSTPTEPADQSVPDQNDGSLNAPSTPNKIDRTTVGPTDRERAMLILHFAKKEKEELTKSFVKEVYQFEEDVDEEYLRDKFPKVLDGVSPNDKPQRAVFIQGIVAYTYRLDGGVYRSVIWRDAQTIAELLCGVKPEESGVEANKLLEKLEIAVSEKQKKGRLNSFSAVLTWIDAHRNTKQRSDP